MKKALNVTFAVVAMLALAACGSDDKAENGQDTTATENTTPAPEPEPIAVDTTTTGTEDMGTEN